MNSFAILGIHDAAVRTVNSYSLGGEYLGPKNVARVRMFVGDKVVDQDFALPSLPESVAISAELYRDLLAGSIEKRMTELEESFPESDEPVVQIDDVVTDDITIPTQPIVKEETK